MLNAIDEVIKLVVGLGNPDTKYAPTLHNVGFCFVDEVASLNEIKFNNKFQSLISASKVHDAYLAKPLTYMNNSGQAVSAIKNFFKLDNHNILIIHDELAFEPGVNKLKFAGGHNGHNGLRDVISHIGDDFWRLRIGIGYPKTKEDVASYVLKKPKAQDFNLIEESIKNNIDYLDKMLNGNITYAMNLINTKNT